MSSEFRTTRWLIVGGVLLTLAIVSGSYLRQQQMDRLDAKPSGLFNGAQLPGFNLTNQQGLAVSLANLRGDIWLADVIFTRCPGPCLQMTKRLAEIAAALPPGSPVKLVSITTDPDYDIPVVLKRYGERFGVATERWQFLTGPKQEIYRVAVEGLKLVVMDKKPSEREIENDLFIHSTTVALVDKLGRLRGQFPLLEPPTEDEAPAAGSAAASEAQRAREDEARKQTILNAVQALLQEK